MRVSKSIAWQSILAVMVIAAGCAGAGAGSSPSASVRPVGSTAPIGSSGPTSSSSTGLPGASSSPLASGSPTTALDSGAIGVVSGTGAEMVLQGECTLTMPPLPAEDPNATPTPVVTYVGQPYVGGTFELTLAEQTTGTPGASASPMTTSSPLSSTSPISSSSPLASGSPLNSSSPAVPATPGTMASVQLTTTLDTVLGAEPTPTPNPNAPSPTPAIGGRQYTFDDVLPFAVLAENSQLTLAVPQQSIIEATLVGGAIAPNARSGYFTADPGTGTLEYVNFICLSLTVQAAPVEATPTPAGSATPAESATPAASETPLASESPTASGSPAPSASTAP